MNEEKQNTRKSLEYDEIKEDGIYVLEDGKSVRIINKHKTLCINLTTGETREMERVIYHTLENEVTHYSSDFVNVKLYSCM